MSARLRIEWDELADSLWLVPAVSTVVSAILAFALVALDQRITLDDRASSSPWLFGGGAEGARGVLTAIAGTMIGVAGTVFSITIVALQLASSQFTPRVLRHFTGDRGNQVVFGVFIGTFIYALLVLRAVRSQEDDFDRFVPGVSVVGAIVLAIISVGFLIYYIDHIAHSIRVSTVVGRVVRDGEALIDRRFPSRIGEPEPGTDSGPAAPIPSSTVVSAASAGYLQMIVPDALFAIRSDGGEVTIRIEPVVGDFVFQGEALATVWPAPAGDDDLVEAVRRGCVLGSERTLQEDVELPVRQLADIAVKALSPGINDPTTATLCVDRLAQLLLRVARQGAPSVAYRREDSVVRLIVGAPSFARLAGTAFDQIRHFGAGDPTVAVHLLDVLGRMASLVPPVARPELCRQAEQTLAAARDQLGPGGDRARVDAAATWLSLNGRGG